MSKLVSLALWWSAAIAGAGLGLLALSVPASIATAGLAWDYIFCFH
jgi:hypothetical protein